MKPIYVNYELPLTDIPTIGNCTMPKLKVNSRYALVDCGFYPDKEYLTFHVDYGNTQNNVLSDIELMLL